MFLLFFFIILQFDRREREAREASVIPITAKGPHYAEFVQHKLNVCSEGFVVSQSNAQCKHS